jgi:hypothetical protein
MAPPNTHAGDWVQQKSVKDQMLRVFIRHVDYDHLHLEEGVRLFVAERAVPGIGEDGGVAKQIQGFVLVDPLWRDGEVYGYVTSLNRMRRDGHHGGSYAESGSLSRFCPLCVGPGQLAFGRFSAHRKTWVLPRLPPHIARASRCKPVLPAQPVLC